LSTLRRIGATEEITLATESNIALTYHAIGQVEESLRRRKEIYSGTLKLYGREHRDTLLEANNCGLLLRDLRRFEEARSLFRKTLPVARRVLGDNDRLTLKMRWFFAEALYEDPDATLDDIREAVTTLEDTERIARRVMGGAHPTTEGLGTCLRNARAVLRAHETLPSSA
jgi:hypothetical protein